MDRKIKELECKNFDKVLCKSSNIQKIGKLTNVK